MLALRWKDIDFGHKLLIVEKNRTMVKNRGNDSEQKYIIIEGSTKNTKARNLELSEDALNVLRLLKTMVPDDSEDELIVKTRTGAGNTATNLEHRMKTIFHNAGLTELKGGLHIFRKTFATQMYRNGARVKEIAAYIGDLESTTVTYYIAAREKRLVDGNIQQVVPVPLKQEKTG